MIWLLLVILLINDHAAVKSFLGFESEGWFWFWMIVIMIVDAIDTAMMRSER